MTSASATASAALGLTLLTILVYNASPVEGYRPSGAGLSHLAASTPPTTPTPCGADYEGTSGTITSPNYPNDYPEDSDCTWTIRAPPNTKIAVMIENFQVYYEDYLEIRDGNDSSAQSLAKCSNSICPDVTSSSNTLYLRFYSDGSYNYNGFTLSWFSVSCDGDYDGKKGTITSPNYPDYYPVSINCTSTLTAPPNTRITVTFEDFSTTSGDYLDIRDGNDSNAQVIEKCSDSSCSDVRSSNNTLHLYFYSSTSSVAKGFKLLWFTEPNCGEDYTGTKGAITSVNHPNNYPSDGDCVWTITTLSNTQITIHFERFETYNSSDYLQIRDGTDMNAKLLGKCSGSTCSSETSSNNSLYIHFHSSTEDQDIGFKLNWYADLLEEKYCYYCGNSLDSNFHDPSCGEDSYNGHDDKSKKWNACYTTVHYTGDFLSVERGGIENIMEDGTCQTSGSFTTCYCKDDYCNSNLCQNCSSTPPPLTSTKPSQTTPMPLPTSTTIHPYSNTTSNSPISLTPPPTTTNQPTTTSQSPTPTGPLQCFSCIDCNNVNGDTHVDTSEEFLTCFTAIELGNSHFVIRGGSPDYYEDGSCRHVDGVVYECYCTSNICNGDSMDVLLGIVEKW